MSQAPPSSPSSSEDSGAVSLLLDSGPVSLELETAPELDSGVSLDAGVFELDDSTLAELDTGATLEDERSGDSAELDRACSDELSVTEASVPELESSPQATNAAVKSAHKKTRT